MKSMMATLHIFLDIVSHLFLFCLGFSVIFWYFSGTTCLIFSVCKTPFWSPMVSMSLVVVWWEICIGADKDSIILKAIHYVWLSQFWSHFCRTSALFASKAKINVVWNFFAQRMPKGYPELGPSKKNLNCFYSQGDFPECSMDKMSWWKNFWAKSTASYGGSESAWLACFRSGTWAS